MAFYEELFPTGISFGSRGGPRRKTVVSTSGSGYEHRNSQWQNSRREYNAGYGIRDLDDIHEILEFFEGVRGQLHSFRWRDKTDFQSCGPNEVPAYYDQVIGTGDGSTSTFQLVKTYGGDLDSWSRTINKPVDGSVSIGVNGAQVETGWSVDTTTGIVTFDSPVTNSHVVTAGFQFDVPVRFNTDFLEIDYSSFEAGSIQDVPIIEVRL